MKIIRVLIGIKELKNQRNQIMSGPLILMSGPLIFVMR